jgi:hypothetical protein
MQDVHCTMDDQLELRESSPSQQLWVIVAVPIVVAKPRGHAFSQTLQASFLQKWRTMASKEEMSMKILTFLTLNNPLSNLVHIQSIKACHKF